MSAKRYHLFEVYGIELEYMLVSNTLKPTAIVDKLLTKKAGALTSDVENGAIAWSNDTNYIIGFLIVRGMVGVMYKVHILICRFLMIKSLKSYMQPYALSYHLFLVCVQVRQFLMEKTQALKMLDWNITKPIRKKYQN